jgi:predicted CopG family antitoxin
MGTKTIGVRDDVYERLKARKRDDESFTELVDRILDETKSDWREHFRTLEAETAADLESIVSSSRSTAGSALAERQRRVLDEFAESEDTDETA